MGITQVEIAAPAADCYARMVDVSRLPEWLPGVALVEVVSADELGRTARARFTGMPSRGSVSYELAYSYDDDARRLRWHSPNQELRSLRGEAWFEAVTEQRCRLDYSIEAHVSDALPSWAQQVLRAESAEAVAFAFRRWVETR